MNEPRQFRFLVPPFFFGLSLVTGLYFSEFKFGEFLGDASVERLVAIGAIVGAAVVPAGYFITSASIIVLHLLFFIFRRRPYEVILQEQTWTRLWPLLGTFLEQDSRWHLYAGATFDHELLPHGIHEWLQRRWSTFNTSAHSAMAILISHLFSAFLPVLHETGTWLLITGFLLSVFIATACIAWRQTMTMLEFQSTRQLSVSNHR